DELPARPRADGVLAAGERRAGEPPPGVCRRAVGDAVRERVPAAAAAPADQLATGPDDDPEAVVDGEVGRAGQPPPGVGQGVGRLPGALAEDQHLLAGPGGAQGHEARRFWRWLESAPAVCSWIVGGGDIDSPEGCAVLCTGRPATEDEHLTPGP